jgi:hypothetical protein
MHIIGELIYSRMYQVSHIARDDPMIQVWLACI